MRIHLAFAALVAVAVLKSRCGAAVGQLFRAIEVPASAKFHTTHGTESAVAAAFCLAARAAERSIGRV